MTLNGNSLCYCSHSCRGFSSHISQVPTALQARAAAVKAANTVVATGTALEEVQGDTEQVDTFFGTISEPTHVLAQPVVGQGYASSAYAVLVLQRQSVHSFDDFERGAVQALTRRVALGRGL
jgi:hypothetical protein